MFKVTTTYTKENLLELQKYHFYHHKARLICSILGLLFCIVGIIGKIVGGYEHSLFFVIVGFLILLEYNTPLIPNLQAKRILKSDSISLGLENEFTFYEDHFEVVNKRASSNIPYHELYCYKETKKYFFLYINKVSAFMIEKEEHVDEIRTLLQNNIKKK